MPFPVRSLLAPLLLLVLAAGTASADPPPLRSWLLYGGIETPARLANTGGSSPEAGSFDPANADPWFGYDKVQHVTVSFLWTLGSQYTLVNKLDQGERAALPLSIASSAAIGLAKEYYDWRVRRFFSKRDLVADGVGILLAAGLILL